MAILIWREPGPRNNYTERLHFYARNAQCMETVQRLIHP